MLIKQIQDTNFQDYYKTSMLICTAFCDGKCWKERGLTESDCQNEALLAAPNIEMPESEIIERYLANPITHAIIFGGLEPMKQLSDLMRFLHELRHNYHCNDDVVIYTGYYENEIEPIGYNLLKQFPNVIVKWGRYDPTKGPHEEIDPILGIKLSTANQFAQRIS